MTACARWLLGFRCIHCQSEIATMIYGADAPTEEHAVEAARREDERLQDESLWPHVWSWRLK